MRLRNFIAMLAVLTLASAPAQATDIVVIHGIPLDAAANVDVCATLPSGDTAKVIAGFNFGDSFRYVAFGVE